MRRATSSSNQGDAGKASAAQRAAAEQTSGVSTDLSSLAQRLREEVGQFRFVPLVAGA